MFGTGAKSALLAGAATIAFSVSAGASTLSSPTGSNLPSAVSAVGGIVLDLIGTNGTRIVSQLAASTLYVGFAGSNPQSIGTQTGLGAVLGALGGGLSEVAVRVSLYDGDTSPSNFDYHENTLLLNGLSFGDFSDVATDLTDSTGAVFGSTTGFSDDLLATGFFFSNDATLLSDFYATLVGTGAVTFAVNDVDPYDNYYDFTQGIDRSLVDVGTGPVVTPSSVPVPATLPLLLAGLGGFAALRRRKLA